MSGFMQIDTEEIRKRILFMMEKLNLNAASFADQAEITRSVISNIINQKSNVTIETINKILSTYSSWSEAWLLFGIGSPLSSDSSQEPSKIDLQEGASLFNTEFSEPSQRPTSGSTISKDEIIEVVKASYLAIKENDKISEREIQEIKVFFSDGSFETYRKI